MIRTIYLLAILSLASLTTYAQNGPSSAEDIQNAIKAREKLAAQSILENYPVRNIGPVVQGGRIVDIAVNEKDVKEYYVAYASGGVFRTLNNGITFEPIFDNQGSLTIGDIALAPSDKKVIYVGTGEKNSSRSSYAGSGVYKTTDGGENWDFIGLGDVQHVGRVLVHPDNPDVVWVGALGALYTHNEGRGVFKSSDGGKSWRKTLYINDSTGIIDLVINPENPNQLWASAWERTRKAWDFKGNGLGSGIYKSDDGGETWKKITNGFAEGKDVGRIGLDICTSQPNILYAVLDSQQETKEKKEQKDDGKLKITDFIEMSKDEFLKLDEEQLDEFLKDNGFPKKYGAKLVKKQVRKGKYEPKALSEYFGDANRALFDTKIKGAELYRSDDYGETWDKVNSYDLEGVYFTYGYYFGEVKVDPSNPDAVYIYGVPLLKSIDGGKTYARIDSIGDVHVDHHAVWVNPNDSQHVLLGNDGGLYSSYDGGATWRHINNSSVGQFYTVNVDMEKPYNVYGGLQDNGTYFGSSRSVPNRTRHWERVFGGDGMYVAPDPRNSKLVYAGFQFGNYFRIDRAARKTKRITAQHDIGEPTLRFNWRTPVVLSKHNPDIVYMGAQKLFRSLDQGDDWDAISPDLTKNKIQGNVPFSTITSIAESPMKFGLIYVGTDDGNIQLTKSGGGDWQLVSNNLPKDLWVSNIYASHHQEGRVYASLNGYRNDNFSAYLYKSDDYGKNWTSIKGNLPNITVNVVIEDPSHEDIVYTGTDNGTYVSFDQGNNWHLLNAIPNVSSYDMIVHPRDKELVVGTHGRSIYILDVKPFHKLAEEGLDKGVMAFGASPATVRHSENWGEKPYPYLKPREPKTSVIYYVGNDAGNVNIEVYDADNKLVWKDSSKSVKGFNTYSWGLKTKEDGKKKKKTVGENTQYAAKGKYKIKFVNGTVSSEVKFEVK
ncbi:MAG: glycosyl hydrolase [Bacteroidota bacterium]